MQYFVRAEFVEENIAGKPFADVMSWIEMVIHPSLEALEKGIGSRKVTGGVIAGVREGVFMLEASSHEEVGTFLRNLPFWGAMKWTVFPIQSFKSSVEQDKASFKQARAMMSAAGSRV
jgi:hypothetical protein